MQYRYQFASDVVRDGMGLELMDERWNVLAEVFRCDANKSLPISCILKDCRSQKSRSWGRWHGKSLGHSKTEHHCRKA